MQNNDGLVSVIEMIVMTIFTYYSNFKITNTKINLSLKEVIKILFLILFSTLCGFLKYKTNYFILIISLVFIISLMFSKNNIGRSLITTVISLSINYVILMITIVLSFIINKALKINNDFANLFIILSGYIVILCNIFKIKKLKYGISFLKREKQNTYIDVLILNVSGVILFSVSNLGNTRNKFASNMTFSFIIFSIIMFITIQKSLQLYYKQKLLVQELSETKDKLAKKAKEVEELEAENINISKKSHTLVHKQKSLEYKIEEMMSKAEISKEEVAEVRDRIKEIEKDLYKEKTITELDKTEISQIDDMLKYMQSECKKNNIDFELQIKGNIHHMTNNLITKQDLETLLADHIKNAIIAINHTNNINRSILVRLGKIDECYGLYIYDSGIEFEKETLENLGNKPSTTHANEGGTGMGFMNTFDTLRKCKASLIIEEYNEPSKDNYTKAIMIKFDNKNEFKIKTYRENSTI